MSKFREAIDQINALLLNEAKRKRLRRFVTKSKVDQKSLDNRKKRAKKVKLRNIRKKSVAGGRRTQYTATATSFEQSESKTHRCSIIVENRSNKITHMNCSCSDFQSRYRYHRNKDGVNKWNDDNITPKKKMFNPHTREEPKVMNPDNVGHTCKHLIALVTEIIKEEGE